MNIPIPSTPHGLSDFVFRSADRMRIAGCANAVAREGLSLALFCEHEALLDHYLNLLLAQLRQQAPGHSIEVYFPANTDSLLGRFNEALARQSVQQATRAPSSIEGSQIWIVHDAHTLPEAEVQLLARLIQNFPGANIRAIMLMSGAKRQSINLSSFGRKVLRWDIEAPNSEQVQAALEMASNEGRSGPLIQMLKRMDHPAVTTPLDATPWLTAWRQILRPLLNRAQASSKQSSDGISTVKQTCNASLVWPNRTILALGSNNPKLWPCSSFRH